MPAGTVAADYGEAVTAAGTPSGTYALVSMNTSPLTVSNRQDYVVLSIPDSNTPTDWPTEPDTYRWTAVEDRLVGVTSFDEEQTEFGLNYYFFEAPDTVHVTVELEAGGVTLATLTLDQTVQARRADVTAWIALRKVDRQDAIHELVSDLRPYIDAAVVASGANGVPSRMIAAILWQEMHMRYRDGTAEADRFRAALGTPNPPITGPPPTWLERWFGAEDDLVREVELDVTASAFNMPGGGWVSLLAGGKSIGVGQMRQWVAALVLCEIPWREKPPLLPDKSNRSIRDDIDEESDDDWDELSRDKKIEIFNRLRFPKTNVALVAKSLALLKNRPRSGTSCGPTTTVRYPTLTRAQFLGSEEACTLVGQEYNTGPTNVNAALSTPGRYGQAIWRNMVNELPINAPAFFPEPP